MSKRRIIVFHDSDDYYQPVIVKRTCREIPRKNLLCFPEELEYNFYGKKPLRNPKDGSFAVFLSEDTVYLPELVKEAQDLRLTVSGDGTARVKGGDIKDAGAGDILTFGTSSRFDMNWIRRNRYACENGRRPIYDIARDWKTILKAVKDMAKEKDKLERTVYYDGENPLYKDLRAAKDNCGCRSYAHRKRLIPVYKECEERPVKTRKVCFEPETYLEDCRGISGRLHSDFIKVGYRFHPVERKPVCRTTSSYVVYV